MSSFILEYNDESQHLGRDDRDNLITFGDSQCGSDSMETNFRNRIDSYKTFCDDGSMTIHPCSTNVHDTDIQPFPNGLGQQIERL